MVTSAQPLERLIYASRSTSSKDQRAGDVREIFAVSQMHNTAQEITGLLTVCEEHYLQLLEGSSFAVRSLFDRIVKDRRHQDLELLGIYAAEQRVFSNWSMALVERFESEQTTTQRLGVMKARLRSQADFSSADFFRFMLTPGGGQRRAEHTERPSDLVFFCPTGLWGPPVLDRVIAGSTLRAGRTVLVHPEDVAERALLEYVDAHVNGYGFVRAIALPSAALSLAAVHPLFNRLSLVVMLLSLSDLVRLPEHIRSWMTLAREGDPPPNFLIVSSIPVEQIEEKLAALAPTSAHISVARVRLSDAAAIWDAACTYLRSRSPRPATIEKLQPMIGVVGQAVSSLALAGPLAPASAMPIGAQAVPDATDGLIARLLEVTGALQAAIIEVTPPQLRILRPSPTPALADLSWALEFALGQTALAKRLAQNDVLSEMIITTSAHLLVFMRLPTEGYALLVVDRAHAQLGGVRLEMQEVLSQV